MCPSRPGARARAYSSWKITCSHQARARGPRAPSASPDRSTRPRPSCAPRRGAARTPRARRPGLRGRRAARTRPTGRSSSQARASARNASSAAVKREVHGQSAPSVAAMRSRSPAGEPRSESEPRARLRKRCASCSQVKPMPPWICRDSAAHRKKASVAVGLGEGGGGGKLRVVVRGRDAGRPVDRGARRLDGDEHVGQPVLDGLEGADGPVELHAGLRVVGRHLEASLGAAERLGGERDRGAIEACAAAPAAEPMREARSTRTSRSSTVASRRVGSSAGIRCADDARRARVDDEERHAVVARGPGSARRHDEKVRRRSVDDVSLRPRERVALRVLARDGRDAPDIGRRVLGERQRRRRGSRSDARQMRCVRPCPRGARWPRGTPSRRTARTRAPAPSPRRSRRAPPSRAPPLRAPPGSPAPATRAHTPASTRRRRRRSSPVHGGPHLRDAARRREKAPRASLQLGLLGRLNAKFMVDAPN